MYNTCFCFLKLESIQHRTLSQHSAGPLSGYKLFQRTHVLSINCLNNINNMVE